jgi:hypothetical protein
MIAIFPPTAPAFMECALEEIILQEQTDYKRGSSALKNALQIPMAV